MAMNSYMWPNEMFKYKSNLLTVKSINKYNEDGRYQQILEKLNCLETIVKPMRADQYSENQMKEANYIGNRGLDPYSNTNNLDWRDYLSLKWGGNQGGVNQAQT